MILQTIILSGKRVLGRKAQGIQIGYKDSKAYMAYLAVS